MKDKKIMSINKIVPHLWFNTEAKEAAQFYTSLFPESGVTNITTISGTPSGDVPIVRFKLYGIEFMAISAGPMFKINPSISFFIYCGSDSEIVRLYNRLSENGSALMPLDKYPWSNKYAWVKDRYGLTWQLDIDSINSEQKIVPSLLFVNEKSGKVKEAVDFYSSVFSDSKVLMEAPWDESAGMPEGSLLFAQFKLNGYIFNAMSGGALKHEFDFNEAVSFMIYCKDQEEIDYYWEKLTAGGQEQQCGWVKDMFGVSWQIVPVEMDEMMRTKDKEKLARVTESMLKMGKLDLDLLRKAFNNE
ncbi:MAG: VOC family protein [Melioribacteraceae bacterium]|nr:VOC family protein [Melioribacteraceae bacterium]